MELLTCLKYIGGILGAVLALLLVWLLVLVVCSLLVDPNKEYNSHSRFYRFLLDSATAVAIGLCRIPVHVTGIEKLPQAGKAMFVCNHRSNFDPIVTWYALKKWKLAFVSKAENFSVPLFGRIICKCCFMAIDREDPRKAITTINRAAKLLRKQEVSVGVYPEGTRSKTGQLLPFHNGVFKIAKKADAPIVVLSIAGTENIKKNAPLRKTDVYLDVLEVFSSEDTKNLKTETIGAMTRHLMVTNIEKRDKTWQKHM